MVSMEYTFKNALKANFSIESRYARWESETGQWQRPTIGPFLTQMDVAANSSIT